MAATDAATRAANIHTAVARSFPRSVTVLVPAHNEAVTIAATLRSLREQSRAPQRIVVIADNCTDATEEIAQAAGVDVLRTVRNTDKKAGGLNQALQQLLPQAEPGELFLVMDADTELAPAFLEEADAAFAADPGLGAAGGLFFGDPGGGLVGEFQRNEYHRYQRETVLKGGPPMVLTGTATVFAAEALDAVARARGTVLPGAPGQVYDTLALTEDNELTIALKTLGWRTTSPDGCTVSTEVMVDWRSLWRQRERWQRGALENLRNYGWTSVTRRYWLQQLGISYGVLALWAFFLLFVLTVLSTATWALSWFWLVISAVFVVERTTTVWGRGPRARGVAALLVPEIVYDTFIQAVFVKSAFDFLLRRGSDWNYVLRES
jgi:cellulose synthase/poly-beta-1,6-N-acetylglucosamine synthase-like glycosyltransferase